MPVLSEAACAIQTASIGNRPFIRGSTNIAVQKKKPRSDFFSFVGLFVCVHKKGLISESNNNNTTDSSSNYDDKLDRRNNDEEEKSETNAIHETRIARLNDFYMAGQKRFMDLNFWRESKNLLLLFFTTAKGQKNETFFSPTKLSRTEEQKITFA